MTTIYDVARAAKVSPKTVSRVLNGDAPVGEKTRAAVEQAIQSLGYVRSSAARMMRSNRSGLIGLITGAISHSPASPDPVGLPDIYIVQGIQRVLRNSGMTLMIADTDDVSEKTPELIRTFLEHRVEGLIYAAEYLQQIDLPPLPTGTRMVLANCFDTRGTPAVIPDDQRGQQDLTTRLIEAGHRRIAYLSLGRDVLATGLRVTGYREALHAAGLSYDAALVAQTHLSAAVDDPQALSAMIDGLLALAEPPSVICCGNDKMALAVYGMLRSRGLAVPEQISVAGYDNYRLIAETLYPPLTTVELPYSQIGELAAKTLLELIEHPNADRPATPQRVSGPVCWRSSVIAC